MELAHPTGSDLRASLGLMEPSALGRIRTRYAMQTVLSGPAGGKGCNPALPATSGRIQKEVPRPPKPSEGFDKRGDPSTMGCESPPEASLSSSRTGKDPFAKRHIDEFKMIVVLFRRQLAANLRELPGGARMTSKAAISVLAAVAKGLIFRRLL